MSFLGSIGCLMQGTELHAALKNVYATVTVSHMFSGKVFARAIHGHMSCLSADFSLHLTSFHLFEMWISKIYDSSNSALTEISDSAKRLMSWLRDKKLELTSKLRTSNLCLNYIQSVSISQQFIKTQRTFLQQNKS